MSFATHHHRLALLRDPGLLLSSSLYDSTAGSDAIAYEDGTSSRKRAKYSDQHQLFSGMTPGTNHTNHNESAVGGQGFVFPSAQLPFSEYGRIGSLQLSTPPALLSRPPVAWMEQHLLGSPPFTMGAAGVTRSMAQLSEGPCIPTPQLHSTLPVDELLFLEAMVRASVVQKKRPLLSNEPSPSSQSILFREEPPLPVFSRREPEPMTNTVAGQSFQEALLKSSKGDEPAPTFRPVLVSCPHDSLFLSEHQTFLRTHVEVFAATAQDIEVPTKGRNTKRLRVGQIGVRCRHCAHIAMNHRTKGSTYFPVSTMGIYQATQNMCTMHLQCGLCPEMTDTTRELFSYYLARKTAAGSNAGRAYWTQQAKLLGLVDTDAGIFPTNAIPLGVNPLSSDQMKHYSTKRKSNATSSEK